MRNDKYKIEKLSQSDYETFTDMFLDYFVNDENIKYDINKLKENLIKNTIIKRYEENMIFIDVIKGDQCLGFIIYQIDSDKSDWNERPGQGFIREFYIKRDCRKMGLGSQLLLHAEKFLKDLEVNKVYLTASKKKYVQAFYVKNGYINTNERSKQNGFLIFEKNIG